MPERGPWEDYQTTTVERGPWEDYKPTAAPPDAPKVPTPLEKFYEAVGENLGWPVVRDLLALGARTGKTDAEKLAKAKETVGGLLQGIAAEPGRVSQELRSFQDTLARGDIPGAAYHLAGGVPLIGAPAQQVAQDLEQGEYARAAGHAVGLAVPFTKPIAKAGAVRAGQVAEAAGPVVKGAVREAVKESLAPGKVTAKVVSIPVPRIVESAVTGKLAGSYLGGPVGGAVGLTAGAALPVVRGAVRGARQVLKARAAAAADALRAQTLAERPPVIPPERRLTPPPLVTEPPPDTSYVRGVAAEYPEVVPRIIPPERRLAAPPPEPIITEPPPDTSYVRGIPAEYPEVIPPALRGKPAAEAAARELQTALQEPTAPPAIAPEPDITPRNAIAQTAAHELATEQIAQMLHDNGISAQDALTFDPSDWQNLTGSVMRGTTDVPPSLTRDVAMRLREIERTAAPSPAPSAPPVPETPPAEPPKPQTIAQAQAEVKAAQKTAPAEPDLITAPDYVYHGTSSETLKRIQEQGSIRPSTIGRTIHHAGEHPEAQAGVYISSSPISAMTFAHSAAEKAGGTPVVIRIPKSALKNLRPDPEAASGLIHEEPIQASYIEQIYDINSAADVDTLMQERAAAMARRTEPRAKEAGQALREGLGLAEGELRTPTEAAKPAPTASETRVNRLAKDIAEGKLAMAEVEKFNTPQGRMILEDHAVRKGMARPGRGEVEQIVAKVRELREGAAATAVPGAEAPTATAPFSVGQQVEWTTNNVNRSGTVVGFGGPESFMPEGFVEVRMPDRKTRIVRADVLREAAAPTPAPSAAPVAEAPVREPLKPTTVAEEQAKFKAAKKATKPAKEPAAMNPAEINRRLDALDKKRSQLTERMIDEGRGDERPSEYYKKTDPLSQTIKAADDEIAGLRREIERRYGPGAPSRLPRGFKRMKGFFD